MRVVDVDADWLRTTMVLVVVAEREEELKGRDEVLGRLAEVIAFIPNDVFLTLSLTESGTYVALSSL